MRPQLNTKDTSNYGMFRVVESFPERITLIKYLITENILQVTLYRMYLILYTHTHTHTKASSMINLKEVMNFYEGK